MATRRPATRSTASDAIWSHRWYSNLQAGGARRLDRRQHRLQRRRVRPRRHRGQPGAQQPDRRLGGRLHDPAGERWPRRVRPRVRPRPRPAGPLRHLRQHRRWRELHRLLDPDVVRRQHRRRRRHHRRRARPTWACGSCCQLGWLDAQGDKGPFYDVAQRRRAQVDARARARTRPATDNGRAGALHASCPTRRSRSSWGLGSRKSVSQVLLVHAGRRPQHDDDEDRHHRDRRSLPRSNYEIEADWDYAFLEASTDDGTTWTPGPRPTGPTRPPTPATTRAASTPGQRASPVLSGGWADADGDAAGRHHCGALPLPDRRRSGRERFPRRRHRDRRHASSAPRRPRPRAGPSTASSTTTGSEVEKFFNAYVAENRQYDGYDTSLTTAYNFGYANTQSGLGGALPLPGRSAASATGTSRRRTTTWATTRAQGLILPIDAHPTFHALGRRHADASSHH